MLVTGRNLSAPEVTSNELPFGVKGFPTTKLDANSPLYRLYKHTFATPGIRSGWYFSSIGAPRAGRFDLPQPHGTCYFSTEKFGAWSEIFRGAHFVNGTDIDCRTLLTASRTANIRFANMADRGATGFGVTLDDFSGDNYTRPQAWALAFHAAKFGGVIALLRHDPSGRARNVGVFGKSGAVKSVRGWQTTRATPRSDTQLLKELRNAGISVLEIPNDVVITSFSP